MEHSDRHRESCIACMPEELGQCFHQIHLRVVWMQRVWTQHRQLFPLDNRHAHLLQRTAPEFFQIVFDELWDATLLWIAKLLDKPEGHNKEMGRVGNLTLAALIGICPEESRDPLWKDQLGALKAKAATILAHRDSRIGHLDRGQALGRDLTPLPASPCGGGGSGIGRHLRLHERCRRPLRYGTTTIWPNAVLGQCRGSAEAFGACRGGVVDVAGSRRQRLLKRERRLTAPYSFSGTAVYLRGSASTSCGCPSCSERSWLAGGLGTQMATPAAFFCVAGTPTPRPTPPWRP